MHETLSHRITLIIMTVFFAALAMNIAVPAFVLGAMGLVRWGVLRSGDELLLQGRTA